MRSSTCASAAAGSALLRSRLLPLLLLATLACIANASKPIVTGELRCKCVKTTQKIHPKIIASVEVITAGPHCARNEVIATLKKGTELCLNPEAPWVKKVIQRFLDNDSPL
ncbi:permeability factor 2 [Sarcophilus harrisii]|uniref:C-X-C motif chemokine n=1 Tax=Sarcophilus harrisii TaxID=9305 RepID=G3WUB0_SARHA|nr:permeability factor 2 [Sarcophilus harrisii]XP_012407412.1 permeability factor 2 [Sarcophilus harrisii]